MCRGHLAAHGQAPRGAGARMISISRAFKPHASHKMGKAHAVVWAPAGTPRFYSVRTCKGCGAEMGSHAAGAFADEHLEIRCDAAKSPREDVHTTHCCKHHGCKYGEHDTCPVATGQAK